MYCINCGEEIPDGSSVCPSCNTEIVKKENIVNVSTNNEDVKTKTVNNKSNNGLAALSLIIPPLGAVYYFMSKKTVPDRAKAALKGTIFGCATYVLATLIFLEFALPIVKKFSLKYECVKNVPGSVYNYQTYTCKHPDGSEYVKIPDL